MATGFTGTITLDVGNSIPDWDAFTATKAPDGAPNVLVILYYDTGLAAWSPHGGPIEMPTGRWAMPTSGNAGDGQFITGQHRLRVAMLKQ